MIPLSMFDADIGEKFQPYFQKNQTCAFIGSSGVGKSTLINKLLGNTVMETQEIGRGDKGRHTTTGREMFPCPLGGVVIDTPGMREMGAESADLSKTFAEIEELARHCRFRDCTHTSEPGCAVLAAVESVNWTAAAWKAITSWSMRPAMMDSAARRSKSKSASVCSKKWAV